MENTERNKMGVMPVNKLLVSMSLPMVLSMLMQALYNVVDSIFVAKLSENALTSVSLAFPLQSLMIGVGVGTGVGMNALLSRSLGEGDHERVRKAATNGIFLSAMSFVAFLIIGLTCVRPFFLTQTDNMEIVNMGTDYLTVCCAMSFGLFGQIVFERLLQSTGKTNLAMISQITGAITNIIFDPIMIFGYLGFPAMGVTGAALATVLGQVVGMTIGIILAVKNNPEAPVDFRGFRPDAATIKRIYGVGIPSIVMQCIGSVMTYCLNRILIGFTTTAAAVFGVYFKLQSFVFMPVFGLNNGMVPIIAYNYGARKPERITSVIKLSVIYAMSLMLAGTLAFELIPETLLGFFNASADMTEMGVKALRIIGLHFTFAGFCIVSGSVFQAMGRGVYSLIVSVARQLAVLLPVAYLMSLTGILEMVWWSFPIAEVVSVIVNVILMRKVYVKDIKPLMGEAAQGN